MAKSKKQKEVEVTDTPEQTDDGVVTEIKEADSNGNRYMPGMEQEVIVIPELREAVRKEKLELVPPFQAAQKALSAQKELTKALVEKHKDKFFLDEAKNIRVYDDGDIRIEVQEKDAISYEVKKVEE